MAYTRKPTRRVRSTGAEELPASPVEQTATRGVPESTDAEPFEQSEPVEARLPHLDAEFELRADPPEPFTASVGWLSDQDSFQTTETAAETADASGGETKVVTPSKRSSPRTAKARADTKSGDTKSG